MKKAFVPVFLLLILFLFLPQAGSASTYSSIVAFGDSLSDNGNAAFSGGTPQNPNDISNSADLFGFGVASNGNVWLDYLAEDLGVSLLDMAYCAARTNSNPWGGAGTSGPGAFDWQIDQYLTSNSGSIDSNALGEK